MAYAWFDKGNGRSVYRRVRDDAPRAPSAFPRPGLALDTLDEPLYSGADGKLYTSKSALRASYLPSGNPDGIRYDEVGNETVPHTPPEPDTKGIDDSINRAIARLSS